MRPAGSRTDDVAPEPRGGAVGARTPAPVATTKELIDFELAAPTNDRRAKAQQIRRRFAISSGRYYLELHRAIETDQALAYRPREVQRLRDELASRRLRLALSTQPVARAVTHHPSTNARPLRATGGTMDGQTGLAFTFPATGESEKQLGMARADAAAEVAWRERVDDAIRLLAAGGGEFTADDVREMTGAPPSHPNAMGARFFHAAKVGVIRSVGFKKSERASLHAHHIRVWTGTRPEAATTSAA